MKIFNWKKEANVNDVKRHILSLEAAILYYKNRNNTERLNEVTEELNSCKSFYKLK
jgi:hypothetical protein